MKAINEAAAEYAAQERTTRSEHAAFVAGVEWANRWIPIEEELPENNVSALLMYENGVYLGCRDGNLFFTDLGSFACKPTHWRPVEMK